MEDRFDSDFDVDDELFFFFLVLFGWYGDLELLVSSSSSLGDGINASRIFGNGLTSTKTESFSPPIVPCFGASTAENSPLSETGSSLVAMRFAGFASGICIFRHGVSGRGVATISGLSLPVFSISSNDTSPEDFKPTLLVDRESHFFSSNLESD